MEAVEIQVVLRNETGKGVATKLRTQGVVPAVAYGPGTDKTLSLTVNSRDVVRVLNRPTGKNTPVTLVAGDMTKLALIKEVQVHPVSRRLLHVDFLVTHPEHEVLAVVPVEVLGKSKGEEAGASRYLAAREIKVKCLPQSIPEKLTFDCTHMEMGTTAYVDDLKYPEGVRPVFKTHYPVLLIEKAREDDKPSTPGAAAEEKAAE